MKKNTIKKLTALLVLLVLTLNLIACGKAVYSDSPYLGTWIGTTAEYSGLEMGVEEILGGEFTFTLENNGKCTLSVAGDEEKGKWSETENGFSVVDEFDFVVDGNIAVLDYDGVIMNFVQE